MTSFAARVGSGSGTHVAVTVFAGPDKDHRAKTGTLMMTPAEADDFMFTLNAASPVETATTTAGTAT